MNECVYYDLQNGVGKFRDFCIDFSASRELNAVEINLYGNLSQFTKSNLNGLTAGDTSSIEQLTDNSIAQWSMCPYQNPISDVSFSTKFVAECLFTSTNFDIKISSSSEISSCLSKYLCFRP